MELTAKMVRSILTISRKVQYVKYFNELFTRGIAQLDNHVNAVYNTMYHRFEV